MRRSSGSSVKPSWMLKVYALVTRWWGVIAVKGHLKLFELMNFGSNGKPVCDLVLVNKSAQSNLGRGPHRCESKSLLVTMARSKFAPKVPILVDRSPNPTICLIPGPVRPTMPNGIRIRSAVFPQCTGQADQPTDRQIVHGKVWWL